MADNKKFIIGSRGSKLSLAYSGHVKDLLLKSNSQFDDNSIEIKIIKTSGDILQNKRISDIGAHISETEVDPFVDKLLKEYSLDVKKY